MVDQTGKITGEWHRGPGGGLTRSRHSSKSGYTVHIHDWEFHHFEKVPSGVNRELEEAADELLKAQRRAGSTAHTDRRDWLSEDQLQLRYSREVYNHTGFPDASLFRGVYGRAWNPQPPRPARFSLAMDPWRQDFYESEGFMPGFSVPNWAREEVTSGSHFVPQPRGEKRS